MSDVEMIIAQAFADFLVAILSAAVIGAFAYFFRKKIFNYMADSMLMRDIGITKLKKASRFSNSELNRIFLHASAVKIYYKTGQRFWNRLENEHLLSETSVRNPNIKIKVILSGKDRKQSQAIYDAEISCGSRFSSEPTINEEVDNVSKVLKKYSYIEFKTDPDMFFLPYLIAEYHYNRKKRKVCYLGLNVIPARSPNSLQIISEKTISEDEISFPFESNPADAISNATLVEQLELHFDTAWKIIDLYSSE